MAVAGVLVVDDEPNILFVLKTALTELGHRVTTAANGADALAFLRTTADLPEIVLLDLLMPGLSGHEVLDAMRADSRLAPIPVILVTGSATAHDRLPPPCTYEALVNKPFDLWALTDLVDEVARGRRAPLAAVAAGALGPA